MTNDEFFLEDLLFGADAIAGFLGMTRRQVYHSASMEHLPIFRIGSSLCCRKSTLIEWIVEREQSTAAFRRMRSRAEATLAESQSNSKTGGR